MSKCLKKIFIVALALCCALSVQLSVSAIDSGNVKLEDLQQWISGIFTTSSTAQTESVAVKNLAVGDIDSDGKITAADARTVLRVSANLDVLTASASERADVDGNGVINAADARLILRYSVKLIVEF